MKQLQHVLTELDELGARIAALHSLGAGFAAAIDAGTIRSADVYTLISGYTSGLVELQRRISGEVESVVDRCSVPCAGHRDHVSQDGTHPTAPGASSNRHRRQPCHSGTDSMAAG